MAKNADLFYAYCLGWRDGAGVRPIQSGYVEHKDKAIKSAYMEGFHDGQAARKKAAAKAERQYDYKPMIVRTQKK
jgi:hypothetical protein